MTIVFVMATFAKCFKLFGLFVRLDDALRTFPLPTLLGRGRGEQNRVVLCWLLTPKGLSVTTADVSSSFFNE
jgi:hypothetical protein